MEVKTKTKTGLLKKFHALLAVNGIDAAGKEAILAGYGVESSRDLSLADLVDVCNRLAGMSRPADADMWRKRVMGAIGSYLRAMGSENSAARIKSIACRAAEVNDFNRIGTDRLRSLYNSFSKQEKDLKTTHKVTVDELRRRAMAN